MEEKLNYEREKAEVATMPQFRLGQEVKTPEGVGLIVSLRMPHNGLYLSPESAMATVWFSTERAFHESIKWVSREYSLENIESIQL